MKLKNRFLDRVSKLKKNHGSKIVISKFLLFLLNPLVSFRTVYTLNINEVDWSGFRDRSLNFSSMTIEDLEKIFKEHTDEITEKRYKSLKDIINNDNSACFKVTDAKSEICSYNCLAFRNPEFKKLLSKIKNIELNKTGYIFKEYTFKKFRNQGIQTFAYYKRFQILQEKGYQMVFTRIAKHNFVAEYNSEKIGFKKALLEIQFHFFQFFPKSNYIFFKI